MIKEELLKPRYKVIGDYPGNPFKIGQVLDVDNGESVMYNWQHMMESYPHLFKPLQWWEERELKDMPEYVKYWDVSFYFPIDIVCRGKEAPFNAYHYTADNFRPATEQEYNAYISKK